MRDIRTNPLVPQQHGHTVHLVLDDFGAAGRAYVETDDTQAGAVAIVANMLSGQYRAPVRVVAFNTAEHWSHDVSEAVAREVCRQAFHDEILLPAAIRDFIERAAGIDAALKCSWARPEEV